MGDEVPKTWDQIVSFYLHLHSTVDHENSFNGASPSTEYIQSAHGVTE